MPTKPRKATEAMAVPPAFRYLLPHLQRCASPAVQRSIFPRLSTPLRRNLSLFFSTSQKPTSPRPLATSKTAKGKCQHLSSILVQITRALDPFGDIY